MIKSPEISHSQSLPRTRLQCFWGVCALASPPGYSPTICQAGSSLARHSPPLQLSDLLEHDAVPHVRRRIPQIKPAPAQSYFPACTSDTCRKPLYQTERRGQTLSSFTLHSFGRPLIDREKRDRLLAALQQWCFSRFYNYNYNHEEEVNPELPPSHTENLNLYVSMWGKIILHWAQGAMKTEGNDFSGTSHSCIKMQKKERERESACGL